MRGPNAIAFAGDFPFQMAPNTGNFACIEHMRFPCEEIIVKTVSGSVATYATTQQLTDETVDRICVLVYDIIR